jgi:hypothetical protein
LFTYPVVQTFLFEPIEIPSGIPVVQTFLFEPIEMLLTLDISKLFPAGMPELRFHYEIV